MTPLARASSMAARVFVLLLIGTTAAALLAFTVGDLQRRETERRAHELRVVDRLSDTVQVLKRAPTNLRPLLLGRGPEAIRLAPADQPHGDEDPSLTARLRARLGDPSALVFLSLDGGCRPSPPGPDSVAVDPLLAAPPPPPPPPGPATGPRGPRRDCRLVSVALALGDRVLLSVPTGPPPPPRTPSPFSPALVAVLALGAAGLALVTARLATAPLLRLSRAADALAGDLDRPPLIEEGPVEVRRAARAFNAMQAQLRRRQAERTHMLAAITHDLQTPLTRLRLRLERVADPELRAQLIADQAAMVDLVRDGLALARAAEGDGEALEPLDVDSLLHSLCADAVEAGETVAITGVCGSAALTRSQALKRCVGNLLENALKHAGAAELRASERSADVLIEVLDHGPGIPADRLDDVFEPFVRLETSRSRETGGAGLGLTIARLLAERADAELVLAARPGGGLCASLRLRRA